MDTRVTTHEGVDKLFTNKGGQGNGHAHILKRKTFRSSEHHAPRGINN
jgi:hypothetical protein